VRKWQIVRNSIIDHRAHLRKSQVKIFPLFETRETSHFASKYQFRIDLSQFGCKELELFLIDCNSEIQWASLSNWSLKNLLNQNPIKIIVHFSKCNANTIWFEFNSLAIFYFNKLWFIFNIRRKKNISIILIET
jgi:hypothetical protein